MKMAPVSYCVWAFKRTLFHREPNIEDFVYIEGYSLELTQFTG